MGVFAAIARQHTAERVQLWLLGWAFVLARAIVQFVHAPSGGLGHIGLSITLTGTELSSIAFLASVAPKATNWKRQLLLGAVLGLPALAYTNGMIWELEARSFYYGLVVVTTFAVLALIWRWHRKLTSYVVGVSSGVLVLSAILLWGIATGRDDYGVHLILAALNFSTAGLYWYRFRRTSAGVLATVIGFFAWGLTFFGGLMLRSYLPLAHVGAEVWNIPKYLVAVGMIVTLLEDQIRQSEHLAYHDALTGLPNRRLLKDRMEQALAHAERSGHQVAVLLLDLDDFKDVNDSFGHRIGDAALQQVVTRLVTRMRASDTLARTGGDEFTVVSEVTSRQGAETLVSALEAALILPVKVEGRLIRTRVSAGYAMYPEDGRDPGELCAAADKAMYASKRDNRATRSAGGNRQ